MEPIALSQSAMILQTFGTSQQVSDEKVWESVTNTVNDVTRLICTKFDNQINTQSFNVVVYVSQSNANAKDMFNDIHMSDEMKKILRRLGPKNYLSFLLRMSKKRIVVKQENSEVKQIQKTEQEGSEEHDVQVMETRRRKQKNEVQIIKEEEENSHELVKELTEKPNRKVKLYNLRPKQNKLKKKTTRKVSIPVGKFVQRKMRSSSSKAKSKLRQHKS